MQELMCFARGHAGSWEALCIDFDIAVQGASFEEVQRELGNAIGDYIAFAKDQDEKTKAQLLERRAPIRVVLLWVARVAWLNMWRAKNHETSASFPIACRA